MKTRLFLSLLFVSSIACADILPGSVDSKVDVIAGDAPSGGASGRTLSSDLAKTYNGAVSSTWNRMTFYVNWPYLMVRVPWGSGTRYGYFNYTAGVPSTYPTSFSDLRKGFIKRYKSSHYGGEIEVVTLNVSSEGIHYHVDDEGHITEHFFTWVK